MAKKKKAPSKRPQHTPTLPWPLLSGLGEAEGLMGRERWAEARTTLDELDRRYPNRAEVLGLLVNLAFELNDTELYQDAAERLLRLTPKDADLTLGLAGAYMVNNRLSLALRAFRRFLEHWPTHARAAEARETVGRLEAALAVALPLLGLEGVEGEEAFALHAQHEDIMSLVETGRFARARTLAEDLLRRQPNLTPVLNNLSQSYFGEGQTDRAIATAQRVLALDADNYHALANMVRYLCLSGRIDEARSYAERLKPVRSDLADMWLKKAEALTYLGDDQGVLDVLHGAETVGDAAASGWLYHLAAVATLRLGREGEARRLWARALKLESGMNLARENVEDLSKPIGERHAPWPFAFAQWVRPELIAMYAQEVLAVVESGDPRTIAAVQQRLLRQHPDLGHVIPLLLDRGDPHGREIALRIALESKAEGLAPALRDFARGQRGPDMMRNQAAQAARIAGLLPAGPLRLWVQGAWREVEVVGFELHGEAFTRHGPRVEALSIEAMKALRRGEGARGERLVEQALALEPDSPDLLNNLASAYSLQGRARESRGLIESIHDKYPDYLFGRTNLAIHYIGDGRLDEAEELLAPLRARKRFHYSEFNAYMDTQIDLYMARKDLPSARRLFDMWAATNPDTPTFAIRQRQLGLTGSGPSALGPAGLKPRRAREPEPEPQPRPRSWLAGPTTRRRG